MSEAAPARVSATIAAALNALGLESPTITPLAGGALNRSFRLQEGGQDLVLRVSGKPAEALGASVRSEYAMQVLAADAGLAPAVVLADPARGFVVSRHEPGYAPQARDMQDGHLLRRIGAWTARLHALDAPAGLPIVDFGERAAGYLERVAAERDDGFIERLQGELARRRASLPAPARRAPCHHDLHRRNWLDDGRRLLAVDWEYAGPGDPAADLASCIGYHALDAGASEALLDGYGRKDAEFRARVAALGWIFDCLWYGWNAVAAQEGIAPDPDEQSRLAARLAH